MIYNKILGARNKSRLLAVLIDPDSYKLSSLDTLLAECEKAGADFILVGGSLVSGPVDKTVARIKELSKIPVILFPGSLLQISPLADGILLLSLISGRNPELLIGNHVTAAHMLRQSRLEVLPTGYILVENGKYTSVEYVSNTRPIPANKPELAVATALAGELLGLKLIYLEAGSGAGSTVPASTIKAVKKQIGIPLIVGGGIRTPDMLEEIYLSGADMAVVGTAIENCPGLLSEMAGVRRRF